MLLKQTLDGIWTNVLYSQFCFDTILAHLGTLLGGNLHNLSISSYIAFPLVVESADVNIARSPCIPHEHRPIQS